MRAFDLRVRHVRLVAASKIFGFYGAALRKRSRPGFFHGNRGMTHSSITSLVGHLDVIAPALDSAPGLEETPLSGNQALD